MPFVLLNTVVGSMAAYGLAGMRDQARALFLNMLLTSLQSLISTQLQIFCVWLTPNQVCSAGGGGGGKGAAD